MGSVNKVILVGNLGRDAELRYTPGGAAVSKFSLATTEVWTDKQGQRQERTEWHNIDLWGKQAENAADQAEEVVDEAGPGPATTAEATHAIQPHPAEAASELSES